jgi:RNA polymerase sigma-70 factor (ECF subfamily)
VPVDDRGAPVPRGAIVDGIPTEPIGALVDSVIVRISSGARPDLDFEAFFDQHYAEVVRTLALAVGDPARAEDAAQEAFAKAYRRWPQVAAMDRPVGWVVVVGANQLRRWMARVERRSIPMAEPRLDDAGGDAGAAPPDALDGVLDRDVLDAALAALPVRQRATVVLRHLCDLPTAEVARALGCAEGTVKSALHAGLRALRVELDEDDRDGVGAVGGGPTTDRAVTEERGPHASR